MCLSGFTVFSLSTKMISPFYFIFKPMKEWPFQIKEKHPVMWPNIQNDPQQWDQWPQHLVRRIFGLISCSTSWVQYRWWIIFMEKLWITKAVQPSSLWQTNLKSTGPSVLTSYLQLISFPFFYDQIMQEQQFRIEKNHLVVRPNIQNDTQQWDQ